MGGSRATHFFILGRRFLGDSVTKPLQAFEKTRVDHLC